MALVGEGESERVREGEIRLNPGMAKAVPGFYVLGFDSAQPSAEIAKSQNRLLAIILSKTSDTWSEFLCG
jgi:hypothetical protein